MYKVFEILFIFTPVLIGAIYLLLKTYFTILSWYQRKFDRNEEKKKSPVMLVVYVILSIYALFLLCFITMFVFFPQVKIPIPIYIIGYIAYLFFWGSLAVLPGLGYASGAGAGPIGKNLKKIMTILRREVSNLEKKGPGDRDAH